MREISKLSVAESVGELAAAPNGRTELRAAAGLSFETQTAILEALPIAVYATDADGRIVWHNEAAVRLWGHRPRLGHDMWCGSWRLLRADGSDLPYNESPMALALRARKPIRGVEAIALRPDGTRVPFLAHPTPFFSANGRLIGAINTLIDLSERKATESAMATRLRKLAALFRLAEDLHRARSLPEVYDSALDAIVSALGCDRAAILLFDDTRVMRFAAWRGLSAHYRKAVEGHSPWNPGSSEPDAIVIPDLHLSNLEPALKATVLSEGIASLAFIPLVAEGRLIGKFMAYYVRLHDFTCQQVEAGLAIGRQLAVAIEKMRAEVSRLRAEEAVRASEARLHMALEAGHMGAWEWEIATGRVTWSPSLEKMHGIDSFGGTFDDFKRDIHPNDIDNVVGRIRSVLDTLGPYHVLYRIVRPDAQTRWVEAHGRVFLDADGRPARLAGVCMDVTERKLQEDQVRVLVKEVNHRSKNMLALVQAVARHTVATDMAQFITRFSERIGALAASQDLLVQSQWRGVELDALVRSQLAHFSDLVGNRIRVEGPRLRLSAAASQTVGMALHELATNAGKYGALSQARGSIEVKWVVLHAEARLSLEWIERGGPPVRPPSGTGFGTTVLTSMVKLGLGAEVILKYAPTGLTWSMNCPVSIALDS